MKNLFSLIVLFLSAGVINAQSLVITPTISDYNGYGVSAVGASDGYIELSVSGGTPPYTFDWDHGETTQNIYNLSEGHYDVIVTDNVGEQAEASYDILEPIGSGLSLNMVTADPKCAGGNDGWVDAQVSGGTPPYTYMWEGGSTASALYDLSAGSYTVTVTDADANTTYNTAILNDQIPLGADFTPFMYSNGEFFSCETCDDGRIDVSPYGGVPPYSILWDNGETGFTRENIAVDAPLSATITDFNSCTYTDGGSLPWGISGGGGSDPLVVTENISLYPNGYNVSAQGMNDGYIELTVSGGLPPYSFNWDHAATTQNVYNLSEGPYGVTVTDDEGTFSYYSYYITAPSGGGSGLDVSDNISMYPNGYNISAPGATDGSIELTPFGGTPPYTFVWDHGPTDQNLYGLGEGMYNVNVYDNAGGNIYKSYYLYGPQQGGGALSVQLNSSYSSCQGYGSIDAVVEGGSSPYFYEWEGPNGDMGGNDSYLDIYQAGTYTLTVTDNNSDIVTASVEILDDGIMTIDLSSPTIDGTSNTSCAGDDGAIDVNITGGVPPYTIEVFEDNGNNFSYTINGTYAQLSGLSAGDYYIDVRDGGGCQDNQNIELLPPPALAITVTPTELQGGYYFSCPTCADGQATAQAFGGSGSYTYQWFVLPQGANVSVEVKGGSLFFNDPELLAGEEDIQPTPLSSGQSISNLSSETWYGVMAVDDQGCDGTKVFNLEKPKEGIEGATGPTGADGATGPTGPQGIAGADGADGTNGVDGATGPQGPTGPQGVAGADGADGTNGVDGATGPQGPTGPQGVAGVDGADGVDGATGAQGPTGPQGVAGADGADGTDGVDGATGAQGPTGPQGDIGPIGFTGPGGATGATGAQGPAGANGLDGATGATGPTGAQGPTGLEGTIGATGPQGPAGTDGTSVVIQGAVANSAALPVSGNAVGEGYLTDDNGHLWVWNGASWTDAGEIRGPQGPAGTDGAQNAWGLGGSSGLNNWLGTNDNTDLVLKANNQTQLKLRADGTTEVSGPLALTGIETIPSTWPCASFLVAASDGTIGEMSVGCGGDPECSPLMPWSESLDGEDNIMLCGYSNVGIGTGYPTHNLHVSGTGRFSTGLGIGTNQQSSARLSIRSTSIAITPLWIEGRYGYPAISVSGNNNSTTYFNVNGDGSLVMEGNSYNPDDEMVKISDENGNLSFRVFNDGQVRVGPPLLQEGDEARLQIGGPNHFIKSRWGDGISLSTYDAEDALVIHQYTGQVNIGGKNTGPHSNYLLGVNGKVLATEFYVTLDEWQGDPWPDYVFEDEYQLRSLSELQVFLKQNKHLPDVPSAEEVMKDGFGMAEMDAILLRKIEELTLYMLEVNEQLETLTKENKELRQQLDELQ